MGVGGGEGWVVVVGPLVGDVVADEVELGCDLV